MNYLATTFNKVGVKFEWFSTPFFGDSPFGHQDDANPWGYDDD